LFFIDIFLDGNERRETPKARAANEPASGVEKFLKYKGDGAFVKRNETTRRF
jgi:hypothetical protein